MTFIAAKLAQLKEAASTGQLRVDLTGSVGTKVLIYQHVNGLLKVIKVARKNVAVAASPQGKFRSRQGIFPRG